MEKTFTILTISGSPRRGSSSAMLLAAAGALVGDGASVTYYDRITDLPHFDPELDTDMPPREVTELRGLIGAHDGLIICTPEYAFSMPSVLKNLLEWTVSSADLYEKPVATISLSPNYGGGQKAHDSLLVTLGAVGARIPPGGSFTAANIRKRMSESGEILDDELKESLRALVESLMRKESVVPTGLK
jgi:NAD(P)H-dependent FMN reductase